MQQRLIQIRRERARRTLLQPVDNSSRRNGTVVQRSLLSNKISSPKLKQQPPARAVVDREVLVKAIRANGKRKVNRRLSSIQALAPQCRPIKTFSSIPAQISTPRFSS